MTCPSCKSDLIVIEFDSIELDYCASCGGVWLDAGELSLILHGRLDADEARLFGEGTRGSRRCPMCRDKMHLAALPKSGVEIDFCPRRHGVWLDKGELQKIIAADADDARVAKLREFCAKVFAAA